jgi:hypothetical protein
MSNSMNPPIATVVTNPTNRDLKYLWLGKNGMHVRAGSSVVLPYCVYTACTSPTKRKMIDKALKTKMVKLTYRTSLPIEAVKKLNPAITAEKPVDAEKPAPAPKKEEPKKEAREDIIVSTGDNKDIVRDSEDLVQKFTGQETTTMRDAMGWEPPVTDDPRSPQEAEVVKMSDAIVENVGDEEEKAAAAAAKDKAAKKTTKKTVDSKRSEAAKKAAATRKANAAKKKAAEKK